MANSSWLKEIKNKERILIFGLGNPLNHLEATRHNVGKKLIKRLAKALKVSLEKDSPFYKKGVKILRNQKTVILAYPLVFMNQSGKALKEALERENLSPQDLILVRDDTDITLGKFKVKFNSGAGGHRGVESVIKELRTKEFCQIKIGVRLPNEKEKAEKIVLTPFPKKELSKLEEVFKAVLNFIFEEIFTSDSESS